MRPNVLRSHPTTISRIRSQRCDCSTPLTFVEVYEAALRQNQWNARTGTFASRWAHQQHVLEIRMLYEATPSDSVCGTWLDLSPGLSPGPRRRQPACPLLRSRFMPAPCIVKFSSPKRGTQIFKREQSIEFNPAYAPSFGTMTHLPLIPLQYLSTIAA